MYVCGLLGWAAGTLMCAERHCCVCCMQVKRKIKKAYCPPQVVEGNPIVDYAKHIVFGYYGRMEVAINGVSMFRAAHDWV